MSGTRIVVGVSGGVDSSVAALRLRDAGFDGRSLLAGHDSHTGLGAIGDLFITGPTGTNVNDFRAILIE